MPLRPYQVELSNKGQQIVSKHGIVCIAMEVRTGKTLTAFAICDKLKDCHNVLMITKKKPIDSGTLHNDFIMFDRTWNLKLINYESVHKISEDNYDCIIVDEFHSLGAYPKPSKRTINIKELFERNKPKYSIMLSGTPSPESYSQLYFPFWINTRYTPFEESSFYKWAKKYVNVKKKKVAKGMEVNDYSDANIDLIKYKIDKLFITYTQKQAGFNTEVNDIIHKVEMQPRTYDIVNKLKKDRVIQGKLGGVILADSAVKLMQKLHQIYSGTVIIEDDNGNTKIVLLDPTKALYIYDNFKDKKMAIFYKYKGEYEIILKHIPNITNDINEFNNDDNKNIALQISSGREGISLKSADVLIMYNIDFSNISYIQGRDRLTTIDRSKNDVHWIFSRRGIENEIYKTITIKKSPFNKVYFDRWQDSDRKIMQLFN